MNDEQANEEQADEPQTDGQPDWQPTSTAEIGLGEYVALLPASIGHALTDDQAVVAILNDRGRTIAHAAVQWDPDVPGHDVARAVAKHLAAVIDRAKMARMLVIGYGPAGPERSELLATHLGMTLGVVPGQVHVQDDTWRTPSTSADGWVAARPLPHDLPTRKLSELTVPDAVLDQCAEPLGPLVTPLFDPMEPDTTTSPEHASPRARATIALRALDRLSGKQPDDPEQMQLLAHLIVSDVVIRDAVLGHAMSGPQRHARTEALVRTFRAAPLTQRPALAATAAAATFYVGRRPSTTVALLEHAGPISRLADVVAVGLTIRIDPDEMRRPGARDARRAVDKSHTAWMAEKNKRPGHSQGRAHRAAPSQTAAGADAARPELDPPGV